MRTQKFRSITKQELVTQLLTSIDNDYVAHAATCDKNIVDQKEKCTCGYLIWLMKTMDLLDKANK